MSRSVDCLSNAEYVLYFQTPDGLEEDGSYNEDMAQMNWDDMMANLKSEIKNKLPSYNDCKEWDSNEVSIFLKNNLCVIAISEYCGLCSLSVAVRSNDYWDNSSLAIRHASQIRKTIEKIVDNVCGTRFIKTGSFSNGTGVFERSDKKEGIYENADRIL